MLTGAAARIQQVPEFETVHSAELFLQIIIFSCFLYVFTALLPDMIRRNSGHIVAVSSIQGKLAIPFRAACMSLRAVFACHFFVKSAECYIINVLKNNL